MFISIKGAAGPNLARYREIYAKNVIHCLSQGGTMPNANDMVNPTTTTPPPHHHHHNHPNTQPQLDTNKLQRSNAMFRMGTISRKTQTYCLIREHFEKQIRHNMKCAQ